MLMQGDGNLVVYNIDNGQVGSTVLWAAATSGTVTTSGAVLASNGNLIIYNNSGTVLWQSNTNNSGTAPYTLNLGDNGILYIMDANGYVVWMSVMNSTSGQGIIPSYNNSSIGPI